VNTYTNFTSKTKSKQLKTVCTKPFEQARKNHYNQSSGDLWSTWLQTPNSCHFYTCNAFKLFVLNTHKFPSYACILWYNHTRSHFTHDLKAVIYKTLNALLLSYLIWSFNHHQVKCTNYENFFCILFLHSSSNYLPEKQGLKKREGKHDVYLMFYKSQNKNVDLLLKY
jgi:hypothetical protein